MAFWVYILRCRDGRYYTGHTDNLDRRIAEHNHGNQLGFTATRRPLALMWSEAFASRYEALSAELQIKKWSRIKKEALIRGDWASLKHFARPPSERVSTTLDTNGRAASEDRGYGA